MIKYKDNDKILNDLKKEDWNEVIADILNILVIYNLSVEDWMKDIITSKDDERKKELVNKWLLDLNSLHGIKQIREKQGLTQKQLADMTGKLQKDICNYETNVKKPSAESLKKIAEALNCSIEDLI